MTAAGAARGGDWRGLILPGLATLVALAILVSLGTWQLRRLEWKEGLIARMQSRAMLRRAPASGSVCTSCGARRLAAVSQSPRYMARRASS